jgi:hypothetical protein
LSILIFEVICFYAAELEFGSEESRTIRAGERNPGPQAYIAAARTKGRVLLDAYLDNQDLNSPRSNLRMVAYLTAVPQVEGLDLQARRRNPTSRGIDNKMVLAHIGGKG